MSIFVGTDKIAKLFVGTDQIKRVWVGEDLVYQSQLWLLGNGADNLSTFTQISGGSNHTTSKNSTTIKLAYTGESGNESASARCYINVDLTGYTKLHATFQRSPNGYFKVGTLANVTSTGNVTVDISALTGTSVPIVVAYTGGSAWPYSGWYAQLSNIWIE